ncbi:MAG: tRNA glutamyl-Q(34) synthetase GluQRS [Methylotenera sp. 24-45-7]|jgi:glutamyl-Q tRNA(Asp) synthetase|nr:MAG: tRNA glutamyl-Q(34) synthetase GluQRS [Mehylophilales bacterium 35-46-6]OYY83314.1 MAG: tRNA glutamyl-Q(34) synthetase GluQRS [Methylophilales bacterium 16-45-9]OYZ39687.1 MAG: tRNA glutamyl-Q(34) synthetase GluQRS [Methylotenera sp. 24-45-7]OZA08697.1 MAG: tRNA glutamyl-Q(34) synthetase GluQRS [Methylotenera sp. 17-45-7]OZA50149.1 MAG: tRNA glutamyl-Q(34) synthetase GluQRS [Methylophilales bacterium 39-45-7]HQS38102.1 tRNA glutamyl-Q(34) synthetase GluQRS [Methylotenera sp.]
MYIGRFAPSPTGPLHFGSLVAAVASYCEAKTHHGKWLLRMEDLDKPREVKGAANTILKQLVAFGFEWDDAIVYQSQRAELYAEALTLLKNQQLVYPCTCTRKEIADSSTHIGIEGAVYPGTCLSHALKENAAVAWRIKTPNQTLCFNDAVQGKICQNLHQDIGDFILKRADGLFAYQLAVVVDDAAQGITHIVRGADLLDSTLRQIYLQQMLHYQTPHYAHLPVACNAAGEKLSKQTLAAPINTENAAYHLFQSLQFLGQTPPSSLQFETHQNIWQWAISHWQLAKVANCKSQIIQIQ